MLSKALHTEFERAISRRVARDGKGRLYVLTLHQDMSGTGALELRRARAPLPRSLCDFSRPVRIGPGPRNGNIQAGVFAAGMVIDHRDRVHVVDNTRTGLSRYYLIDAQNVASPRDIEKRSKGIHPASGTAGALILAGMNSRIGDIVLAPDGKVWLTWITTRRNHRSQVHIGACLNGRWRAFDLTEGYGISPPSVLIGENGTFHLAWNDIFENLYCIKGSLSDLGRKRRWTAVRLMDNARRPAMAEAGGKRIAVFETNSALLDYVLLDEKKPERRFVTWPDPRFIQHSSHSPQFATDPYGVPWLFFIDNARQHVFHTRWMGSEWGPIHNGPRMILNRPRMDDNHLPVDRISVEGRAGRGAAGIPVALTSEGPPSRTEISYVEVPSLKADPGRTILFLDLGEFQTKEGVRLRLNTARKHSGNPILEPGGPTAFDVNGGTFPNVLREGDRYRLWYSGLRVNPKTPWQEWYSVGYAESRDGTVFRRASTDPSRTGRHKEGNRIPGLPYAHSLCCDEQERDPERKYKMISFPSSAQVPEEVRSGRMDPWTETSSGWLWTSANGIRWKKQEACLRFPAGRPLSFIPESMFHDPEEKDPNKRYKAYGFSSLNPARRAGAYAYSPDAVRWTACADNPVLDPFARCVPVVRGGKVHQIHDTVVWRYHGYYLALYQYQHDPEFQDVELAMSRDGERFTFVCPGEKVIPFGPRGCWDASAITPSVPVVAGDRLMLYYGGTGAQPKQLDRTGRNLRETETRVAIGMATLRRDGFTHVEPQDELRRGVMTTIPVYPGRARTLCVNAECGSGASVQVEILEAGRGKVVTGYDRRSCRAIRGDNLDGPVRWAATGLLPHCTEPFQVRFYLNGAHARLFSFSFRE